MAKQMTNEQNIYSQPRKIFMRTETKISKRGVEYTVNHYRNNPDAKVIKTITHQSPHRAI